jgi:hypothetical protein
VGKPRNRSLDRETPTGGLETLTHDTVTLGCFPSSVDPGNLECLTRPSKPKAEAYVCVLRRG